MHINFNKREIELNFGLRALTEIDRELGFEVEGTNLGEGLEMLVPKLQSGSMIAISKVIKAATAHDKKPPKSYEDLETVLEDIAEEKDFKTFGAEIIEELGKRPMTRNLIPEKLREEAEEEDQEATEAKAV